LHWAAEDPRSGLELLVLRIIEIAQLGERDPARLRDDALLYLARTNLKSTDR
jgi:hypothetical protein